MFKVIQVIKNSYPKKKKNSDVSPLIQEASSGPDHLVGFYCTALPQAVLGGRWWSFAWRKECGSPPQSSCCWVWTLVKLSWGGVPGQHSKMLPAGVSPPPLSSEGLSCLTKMAALTPLSKYLSSLSFFLLLAGTPVWRRGGDWRLQFSARSQCCPWDPTPGKFHSCL